MANSIELIKKAVPMLDEVYKQASKTAVLDGDSTLVQAGANANEILIPKISMDGLSDYSRSTGYASGDVSLEYETKKFNYDRGKKFNVDAMDNEETAGIAFGSLSSEFIRTKVVPEVDAFRFSKYAEKAETVKEDGALATGKAVVAAVRAGANAMEEAEIDLAASILFITPTLKAAIEDMDTTASREVLNKFGQVISVPQNRLATKITLGDNGFSKAEDSKDINFVIVDPAAVLQYPKHVVNKVIAPEENQSSDGWLFFYRNYQLAEVKDNKTSGVYVSTK